MRTGHTILTHKQNNGAWHGITQNLKKEGQNCALFWQSNEICLQGYRGMHVGWFSDKWGIINMVCYVHTLKNCVVRSVKGTQWEWCHCTTLHCTSDIRDYHREWLGSVPASTIQSILGPPQITAYLESWMITWEACTMRMNPSRKLCTAGCEVLKWFFTAAGSLSLCSIGRNPWNILEIL